MTWFAVDDSFFSHPKVLALRSGAYEDTALALWLKAGSWCACNLMDGSVPKYVIDTLIRNHGAEAAAELVRVGLWLETDEAYTYRDWTHYQPTKSEVEERRAKGAARTRKSRQQAKERDQKRVSNALQERYQSVSHTVTNGVTNASETLSRPDPSPSLSYERDPRAPEAATDARHVDRFAGSFTEPSDPIAKLAQRFSDARHAAGFGRWRWDGKAYGPDYERLQRIDAGLRDETALGYDAAFEAAMRGLFADARARDARCPIAWLANDLGGYVAAGATSRTASTTTSRIDEIEEAIAANEEARKRAEPGPERDLLGRRRFDLQAELRAARGVA